MVEREDDDGIRAVVGKPMDAPGTPPPLLQQPYIPKPPPTRKQQWVTRLVTGTVMALIALMGVGLYMSGADDRAAREAAEGRRVREQLEREAEQQAKGDATARLACTHFENVVTDAADGILTGSEIRQKMQEVYRTARVSETPGIAQAARDMLAAATTGVDIEQAGMAMADACAEVPAL